jgi:diguanylate cyclase (GGDEF)-like protein
MGTGSAGYPPAAMGSDRSRRREAGRWLGDRHGTDRAGRGHWAWGMAAILLTAGAIGAIGLSLARTQQVDDQAEIDHRQALTNAIEALQAVAPDLPGDDPRVIHILAAASGLSELRFEDGPPDGDREAQSLIDRNGRILGWLSWNPQRQTTAALTSFARLFAPFAAGLLTLAALLLWRMSRLGAALALNRRSLRKVLREEPITGLPNSDEMFDRLERALVAHEVDQRLAFAILVLDGFQDARDLVGDAGADQVLGEVADRLRQALPAGVVIGRARSDHAFTLLMPATDAPAARALAEAARQAVSRPIWVGQALQVAASVGLAVAPRDGLTRAQLVHRADLALRSARRRGGGMVARFAAAMEAEFEEQLFIKRELGRALAARDFDVHYQPIVSGNGAIVGLEALLRWTHPTSGVIAPARFVPVAEEAGLMDQLGEFVLRRALADAKRWPELYVSVNLSPVQVREARLVDLITAVLAETAVPPARLVLEVTEGVLIENPEAAKARLEELRALGLKLALDDFGAGYSSLTYLQRLPFDKLKVDRGFVAALAHSANAGVIIQAVIALGRALNLSVLVEGIETEEQRALVRLAGCDEMQGYLFGQPAARETIDRMLAVTRASAKRPRALAAMAAAG